MSFHHLRLRNSQNTVLTISTLNWKTEKHLLLGLFIHYLRMNAKPYSNTLNITSKKDLFVDPLHLPSLLSFLLNEKPEIQSRCPEHPRNQPHVFKDHVNYDDYISADVDYNLSGECWIIHPSKRRQPYAPSPFYINSPFESFPSNYVFSYRLSYPFFYFLIPTHQ